MIRWWWLFSKENEFSGEGVRIDKNQQQQQQALL